MEHLANQQKQWNIEIATQMPARKTASGRHGVIGPIALSLAMEVSQSERGPRSFLHPMEEQIVRVHLTKLRVVTLTAAPKV